MTVKRKRREFGAPVNFSDRNVADAKDGFIDCVAYEDKSFDLKRIELDKATQSIPEFQDSSAQTDWKYPRNAKTQYEARVYNEEEKENNCTTFQGFTLSKKRKHHEGKISEKNKEVDKENISPKIIQKLNMKKKIQKSKI